MAGFLTTNNPYAAGGGVMGGTGLGVNAYMRKAATAGIPAPVAANSPAASPNPFVRQAAPAMAAPVAAVPAPVAAPTAAPRAGAAGGGKGKGKAKGKNRETAPARTPGTGAIDPNSSQARTKKDRKNAKGGYQGAAGEHAANQNPGQYLDYLLQQGGVGIGSNEGMDSNFSRFVENDWKGQVQKGWDHAQGNNRNVGFGDYVANTYGVPTTDKLYGKTPKKGKKNKKGPSTQAARTPVGVRNPQRLASLTNAAREAYWTSSASRVGNPATAVGWGRTSAWG